MGMIERALSSFSLYGEKRVRFRERSNRVHDVRHLNDYTDEEVAAYWYDRVAYNRMKRNRNQAEERLLPEDDEERSCGLETNNDAALRGAMSMESISSVLLEQDRQWEEEDDRYYDRNVATDLFLNASFAAHLDASARARDLEASIESFVSSGRCWAPVSPSNQKQTRHHRSGSFRKKAPTLPIRMDSFSKMELECQPPKLPTREHSFQSNIMSALMISISEDSFSKKEESECQSPKLLLSGC